MIVDTSSALRRLFCLSDADWRIVSNSLNIVARLLQAFRAGKLVDNHAAPRKKESVEAQAALPLGFSDKAVPQQTPDRCRKAGALDRPLLVLHY